MTTAPPTPARTDSGLETQRFYRADDVTHHDDGLLSDPGVYPFVRGNFAGGYGDRLWTFRRRSCCLYYRVPGSGGLCDDCVLPAGSG